MLTDGVVVAAGKPLEVLTRENIQRVFGIEGHAEVLDGGVDFTLFGCNCHNDDISPRGHGPEDNMK